MTNQHYFRWWLGAIRQQAIIREAILIQFNYVWVSRGQSVLTQSLWPCDSIWWHRSLSTLAQVMACCLMAPSHYLYQCWLVVSKVLWHSSEGNYTRDTSSINHCKKLENDLSKISYKFPWGQWVKIYEHFTVTPGHSHQNLPLIMQGWTWWNKSVLHSHDSKTHIAIIWCNFQTGIMTDILSISCSPVNVIAPCRWKVNIGSGNGWVPLLCRQKAINWVKADRDLWHHMGLLTRPWMSTNFMCYQADTKDHTYLNFLTIRDIRIFFMIFD